MKKQCVYQMLDDDMSWVCPHDANCEELECRGIWDKREKEVKEKAEREAK
jgi:hypothetical protein